MWLGAPLDKRTTYASPGLRVPSINALLIILCLIVNYSALSGKITCLVLNTWLKELHR